jgi:putative nucleotidyltransferase with HDIG domain
MTNIGQGFAMNKALHILYLEDDRNDVELVSTILSNSGLLFKIEHVKDRDSYVYALEQKKFDVILIDYKLPFFDGLSALKIAKEKSADVPLIIISGTISEVKAVQIINEGATDYVLKDRLLRLPFSIRRALHEKMDLIELKLRENKLIESRNAFFNMLKETDSAYKDMKELFESLILSLINALDAKSRWTKGHSERVTNYALSIARAMGLRQNEIDALRIGALLHDIGKIGTYDVLLDKPDRLTAEEFEIVKLHPVRGDEILSPVKQLQNIIPIVRYHHERMDGKGYPDGLKGDEIPLSSRILHVADSYDSMTADRPYRPAPGNEYAISEFKKYSGTQFDQKVVEVFLRVLSPSILNSS